jgi:hypothetical protein
VFVYDTVADWSATESITDYGTSAQNTTALSDAAIAALNGDVLRFDYSNITALTAFAANANFVSATYTGANGNTGGSAIIVQGAGAQAANQAHAQFLYNSTSGLLSIDADGTGVTAKVDIALIGAGKTLTATDFLFIA